MQRLSTVQIIVMVAIFLFIGSMVVGCSSGGDIQAQVSGTWQQPQTGGTVEINLVETPNSLKIDGKTYPATVEKVDKGNNAIFLNVETTNGQTEAWVLRQIWSDNGDSFNLALRRNGTQETLEPGSRS